MLRWGWLSTGLLALGCGGENPTSETAPPTVNPSTILPVTIATSGVSPGTDAYRVVLDNLSTYTAPVNGSLALRVRPGEHLVRLTGLPRHCRVRLIGMLFTEYAWEWTVKLTTPDGGGFSVECFEVGTLRLEIKTTGQGSPSLYIATLDRHPNALLELPINGTVVVRDVSAGSHRVSMSTGPNCRLADTQTHSISQMVDIVRAEEVTLRLGVVCA